MKRLDYTITQDMMKEVDFKYNHHYSDEQISIDFKIGIQKIRTFIHRENMSFTDLQRHTFKAFRDLYLRYGGFEFMAIEVEEDGNL